MSAVRVKPAGERKPFFTPRSLAEYLAVSRTTVYEMLDRGVIPSYKFEGSRRIAAEDVDRYVAASRIRSAA